MVCLFLLDAVMAVLAVKEEAGKRGRHGEGDIMQHVFSSLFCKGLASSKCLSHANKACFEIN